MIGIWAKIIKENKIIRQTVFRSDDALDYGRLAGYVFEICHTLDVPSPVMLKEHILRYAKFNYVAFKPDDFIENVSFDKLIIENIDRG